MARSKLRRSADLTAGLSFKPHASHAARSRLKKDDPRFNVALARGLEILMAFRQGERYLSNVELFERTGIPKATVSRLTYTLGKLGFLRYGEDTGLYELMPPVLALGYNVLSNVELHEIARPFMNDLARDSGGTVGLATRDGLHVIFLESVRGAAQPMPKVAAGTRFPIPQTVLGWAIMATLPAGERAAVMRDLAEEHRHDWRQIEKDLDHAAKEIAERGFCVALGKLMPTHNSAAAPFLHPDGTRLFAVSCYGPASLMTKESLYERWGPRLVELTARLNGSIHGANA